MSLRVGLFGGSFDPIHHGHLILARSVMEAMNLTRVIFLPSRSPPHKPEREFLDANHRAEMVQLAIEGEPRFEFGDFDLIRHGPCYSFDVVLHFRKRFGEEVELCWIVGADSLGELPTWHRFKELVDACRIVTALRPGWDEIDWSALGQVFSEAQVARLREGVIRTPRIEISSTDIRARLREGRSIAYLVPEPVRSYLEAIAAYRQVM